MDWRVERERRAPWWSGRRHVGWRLALAALLLAASACGGGGGEDGGSPGGEAAAKIEEVLTGVDACTLLTRAEIEAAVGNPVEEGVHTVGSHLCNWDTAELEQVSVVLSVWTEPRSVAESMCAEVRGAPAEKQLAGVAAAANWEFRTSPLGSFADLSACTDRAWLGLSLAGEGDEATLQRAARELADKALGRL